MKKTVTNPFILGLLCGIIAALIINILGISALKVLGWVAIAFVIFVLFALLQK